MTDPGDPADDQLQQLAAAERESFERLHSGADPAGAVARMTDFLAMPLREEIRGEALAFRAILFEQQDRFEEARADLLAAHRISSPDTFHRYGIELGLVQVAERQGRLDDALAWARRALATVAADPTTDGSGCVDTLLALAGGESNLAPDERTTGEAVLRRAFTLRDLDAPDDASLAELAALLQSAG